MGLNVQKTSSGLEDLKKVVVGEVRAQYSLETLKDVPVFRAYRDFFWSVGIDPTKIRPAAEALIRRIIAGKEIPTINTLVDAYNLASIRTGIAIAAFDQSRLRGSLSMRYAKAGERFLGIGMSEAIELKGGEVVVSDAEKLIAVYPYRDAESSKVTEETRVVVLMVCGCPNIEEEALQQAEKVVTEFVLRFCGGRQA